jgi:uncharacterized membrane protein
MENEKKREIKKAKTIFGVVFGGSIAVAFTLAALGYYWIGLAIGFVGCLGAVMYTNSVATKYRLGDERSHHIDEKASAFAFKITFAALGVSFAILAGLSNFIDIPAYPVMGLIFVFMSIVYYVATHHYAKKYS